MLAAAELHAARHGIRRMTGPEILYSDDSIAVINKPAGMLSVPGRGPEKEDSAALRLKQQFPLCIEQPSVHRLDMDTSGLMVFALTREAQRGLSIQFQQSSVCKKYIAVLEGLIDSGLGRSGRIELKFRLDPDNRPYQIFDPVRGKNGISLWRLEAFENGNTRVEFKPLTGRTHQLRLHAAHPAGLGRAIVGDRLYGSSCDEAHQNGERMLLHASMLEFQHPQTEERMLFRSPPPF